MSNDRRGFDLLGFMALCALVGTVAAILFFLANLPRDVLIVLAGALGFTIVSLPLVAIVAILMRSKERGSDRAPGPDARYTIEQPDQRSYIAERRQAAQLAELELRELKLEQARARMLPSANQTTPPADTFDTFTPTAQQRPPSRQVIILGEDDDAT